MEKCSSSDQKIGEKFPYRPDSAITTVLAFFFVLFLSGCAPVTEYGIWGEDATIRPGWGRIKNAAINAALDPVTWIPLSGAAVLQIDHMDDDLSEYASDHTPVFGSRKDAGDASDDLRDLARASYYITAVITPGRYNAPDYVESKAKGLLVGEVASVATRETTSVLKDEVGRTRPSGSNDLSFPSGHASTASVRATLACRNINYLPLTKAGKIGLKTGVGALAAGTAWARVEANVHYPADVLAGLSLGHFLGVFFNDAFLSRKQTGNIWFGVQPLGDEIVLTFYRAF